MLFRSITAGSDKIKLEAKEIGTEGRQVRSFDLVNRKADGTQNDVVNQERGVEITAGVDAGREIVATDITEYNGKNFEDAVFTINGHKFVLLTEDHDGNDPNSTAKNDVAMNTTYGVGSDVTVLVGGTGGLTAGNDNFAQNIKKIADVTGLNVTAGIDEATAVGAAPDTGIRLSKGDAATGGLVLQIGDTADSFNKMRSEERRVGKEC